MQYGNLITINDIIKSFLHNVSTESKSKKRPKFSTKECLCNIVKKRLETDFLNIDSYRIMYYITDKIKESYKSDKFKIDTITKCVENLFAGETATERKTLIHIAFALQFSVDECNQLLQSSGFQELHYGGDYIETAIFWCLKRGYSYSACKSTIEDYKRTIEDYELQKVSNDFVVISKKSYSKRSLFYRDIVDDLLNTNVSEGDDKNNLLNTMLILSKNSTAYNYRMHKFLQDVLGTKVTVKKFVNFYCQKVKKNYGKTDEFELLKPEKYVILPEKNKNSINNCFSKFRITKAKPTREFICLISILLFYEENKYKELSLQYINEKLSGFGFSMLSEERIFDRVIIELSKYKVENSGKVYFKGEEILLSSGPKELEKLNLVIKDEFLSSIVYIFSHYVNIEVWVDSFDDIQLQDAPIYDSFDNIQLQDINTILEDF